MKLNFYLLNNSRWLKVLISLGSSVKVCKRHAYWTFRYKTWLITEDIKMEKSNLPNHTGELSRKNSFQITLREKCPNTELFLVRNFLYSDWIRIQFEYRLVRTRSNSVFGHFSRTVKRRITKFWVSPFRNIFMIKF